MGYMDALGNLELAQGWINAARRVGDGDKALTAELDRQQEIVNMRRDLIHSEMFEISRNN